MTSCARTSNPSRRRSIRARTRERGNLQTAAKRIVVQHHAGFGADAESAGLVSETGALCCEDGDARYFINAMPITIPTATAAAAAVIATMGLTVSERSYHGVVRGVASGSDSMICW